MTRKNTRRSSSSRTCLGRSRASRCAQPRSSGPGVARAARVALLTGAATLVAAGAASTARAQQSTFHLDRVEVAGSPDDGFVLSRPYTRQNTIFFAQMALGYSLNPLHTNDIVTGQSANDKATLAASSSAVVSDQFTMYANVGFEFLNRFIVGLAFPVTWIQDGQNPNYAGQSNFFGSTTGGSTFDESGPSAGDTRLDLRGVIWRSEDRKMAIGGQVSVFFPTGTYYQFGGDGSTTALVMVNAEYTTKIVVPVTFVAQTGFDFRPETRVNQPTQGDGLGIGDEWRWAVGAFVPIKHGKYRLGATIFGQTGIAKRQLHREHSVHPTEHADRVAGRGANEVRSEEPLVVGARRRDAHRRGVRRARLPRDRDARSVRPYPRHLAASPDPKVALREKWRSQGMVDTDHDGIPDDIDACPNEPEDHKGTIRTTVAPRPPTATATASRTSSTSARTSPRTRTGSTTPTAARRTTPIKTASPTRATPARASRPAFARSEEERMPAVHQARRVGRARAAAGALRDRLGRRSSPTASRCSRRSRTS